MLLCFWLYACWRLALFRDLEFHSLDSGVRNAKARWTRASNKGSKQVHIYIHAVAHSSANVYFNLFALHTKCVGVLAFRASKNHGRCYPRSPYLCFVRKRDLQTYCTLSHRNAAHCAKLQFPDNKENSFRRAVDLTNSIYCFMYTCIRYMYSFTMMLMRCENFPPEAFYTKCELTQGVFFFLVVVASADWRI